MHATSLQGFGYDDVVHQFENRYNRALSNTNINIIKHYDDIRCFLEPDLVIKEFIEILSNIDSSSDVDRNLLE